MYKLESLSDISVWNSSNINEMPYVFYKCNALKTLPDISKWNTDKVTALSNMFCECRICQIYQNGELIMLLI